jgi:hypothetical protein
MSAILAGGLTVLAQTPPEINGRATPAITQDHFQPESAPPPRLLPLQVREGKPAKLAPPTADNLIGIQVPGVPTPDLDIPILPFGLRLIKDLPSALDAPTFRMPLLPWCESKIVVDEWKARKALEMAEVYFEACELEDARVWYQEVIKLAPGTKVSAIAAERLERTKVRPAAGQSSEPPLADANRPQGRARIR